MVLNQLSLNPDIEINGNESHVEIQRLLDQEGYRPNDLELFGTVNSHRPNDLDLFGTTESTYTTKEIVEFHYEFN